jgi:hypothetical protein
MESEGFHYYSLSYVFGSSYFLNNDIPEIIKTTDKYKNLDQIDLNNEADYINISKY